MHGEVEILSACSPSTAVTYAASLPTTADFKPQYSQSNSHDSHQEDAAEESVVVPLSEPMIAVEGNSVEDDDEYYAQFDQPDESTEDIGYFDDENDEIYLSYRLTHKQLDQANQLEGTPYQRSKRSNKKVKAQRQIKTKQAKSIKLNSHNKQLYMHHRLFKRVQLDPPNCGYLPSPVARSVEVERSRTREENKRAALATRAERQLTTRTPRQPTTQPNTNQFREFTINEQNLSGNGSFDDSMIAFLLDMQNRDLSPNDYEMLLRLDERVQRKTVNRNVLDTLPTVAVNESHLTDQCAICMESYALGQQLKSLPCKHLFHLNCIETYLNEFSTQCPLDNLPLI